MSNLLILLGHTAKLGFLFLLDHIVFIGLYVLNLVSYGQELDEESYCLSVVLLNLLSFGLFSEKYGSQLMDFSGLQLSFLFIPF